MVQLSPIEPSVLRWVIDESGYDDAGVAELVGVEAADIETWTSGDEPVAPRRKVSKLLRELDRSQDIVYLNRVPDGARLQAHFRSMKVGGGRAVGLTPKEIQLVREAHYIQFVVSKVLFVNEASRPELPRLDRTASAESQGASLRRWVLGDHSSPGTNGYTFDQWRNLVERRRVFVLMMDLRRERGADDRQDRDSSSLRGFSLPDEIAPMVVVCTDSKPAKSFTLFHELAHLALGHERRGIGACHVPVLERDGLERQCDSIAGAALVPPPSLRKFAEENRLEDGWSLIKAVAGEFEVSMRAAAVAIENGLHRPGLYRQAFANLYYRDRNPRPTGGGGGGQSRVRLRLAKFGRGLVSALSKYLDTGSFTEAKARRFFDLGGDEVFALAASVGWGDEE